MNILFFLKPKSEVAYVHDYGTLRQVLETMEYHKYACIPYAEPGRGVRGHDHRGRPALGIKQYADFDMKKAENIFIRDFPRKIDYAPVYISSNMEDLLQKSMNQNFVPVVDDDRNSSAS